MAIVSHVAHEDALCGELFSLEMSTVLPIVRDGLARAWGVTVTGIELELAVGRQSSTVGRCSVRTSAGDSSAVWVKVLHGGISGSEVKVHRTIRDCDLTRHLRDVWGEDGPHAVPPALFCSPSDRLIVTGHMEGVRLQDRLMQLGEANGPAIADVASDLRRCGEWLAAFQDATRGYCPGGEKGGAAHLVKGISRIADQTQGRLQEAQAGPKWPLYTVNLGAVRQWVAGRRAKPYDSEQWCAVHGDFFPGNLLVSEDQVVGIDFSSSTWGSPWFDLSYFVFQLETLLRRKRVTLGDQRWLRAAFLEGAGRGDLAENFWRAREESELLWVAQNASRLLTLLSAGDQLVHKRLYCYWRARRLAQELEAFVAGSGPR